MMKDTEEEKVGSSGCPLFMAWVGLFVATLFCFLLLRIFPSLESEEVVWYPFKKWWVLLIVGIFLGGYVGILIERKLPKSKSEDQLKRHRFTDKFFVKLEIEAQLEEG